jgi:hypothetical protein
MTDEPDAGPVQRNGGRRARAAVLATVSALAIVSGVTSPQAAAASGPVTHTNYNRVGTGWHADTYWRIQAKSDDRVAYVPDPLGRRGLVQRITVLPGDNNVFGSSARGERADVIRHGAKQGELGGFVDGETIVMSWSTMIDSNFASPPGDWNNFVNTHVAGGAGQSPWQLNLRGDDAELRMRLYGGGQWSETIQPAGSAAEWFDFGPLPKNKWHDFVAEVKFGCAGNGLARVWMNGKQLVDAVDRTIGYCGDPGLYWKQGFYRASYDKATELWFGDTFRWKNRTDALAHYGWTGHR